MAATLKFLRLLNTDRGIILISVLWGFALSCLFKKVCKGRSCIVLRAPEKKDIQGKIYEHNGSCYRYMPKKSNCHKKNNHPNSAVNLEKQ